MKYINDDATEIDTECVVLGPELVIDRATDTAGRALLTNVLNPADYALIAAEPDAATLTDGATVTIATAGKWYTHRVLIIGGNRTLAITGTITGAHGVLIVQQDGTGSRTLTPPAGSKVAGGGAGALTLTAAANAVDVIEWWWTGLIFLFRASANYT